MDMSVAVIEANKEKDALIQARESKQKAKEDAAAQAQVEANESEEKKEERRREREFNQQTAENELVEAQQGVERVNENKQLSITRAVQDKEEALEFVKEETLALENASKQLEKDLEMAEAAAKQGVIAAEKALTNAPAECAQSKLFAHAMMEEAKQDAKQKWEAGAEEALRKAQQSRDELASMQEQMEDSLDRQVLDAKKAVEEAEDNALAAPGMAERMKKEAIGTQDFTRNRTRTRTFTTHNHTRMSFRS
jgi:hypothetical protein